MPWDSETIHSDRIAIHAALVQTETGAAIMYFDGLFGEAGTRLFDLGSQEVSSVSASPGEHIMCSGHAFLADGRLVVGGGVVNQDLPHGVFMHDSGERRCYVYHPLDQKWEAIADFNFQPNSENNPRGGGRWYPTLLTVGSGEVLAVAGHPYAGKAVGKDEEGNDIIDLTGADDYVFPGDPDHRHNNNTPERYSPASKKWELLTAASSANNNQGIDEYPRVHLAPGGRVFFSTVAEGKKRFYSPYTGTYADKEVEPGDQFYRYSMCGGLRTAVLLPILMSDLNNVWVLVCGGGIDPNDPDNVEQGPPERINIASNADSQWVSAGERELSGKPMRKNACSVILPTGDIFITGGVGPETDEFPDGTSTVIPEIYTPPINWDTGKYTNGDGVWTALTDEPAAVIRGYHSVALLMPDGRVWTAGSTDAAGGGNEFRIEIYSPWYCSEDQQDLRPTVSNAPKNIGYAYTFRFNTQANEIKRVALTRCGSITHSFDADQRMVCVNFKKINSTTLEVTVPFMEDYLPPGRYLLWVIDNEDRPCKSAPFIRISKQKALYSVDFDKFAKSEVDALGIPAKFNNAVYLVYDGFLPGEVTDPTHSFVWKDNNATVPGIKATLGTTKYESGANNKDVGQRIVIPVNIRFTDDTAFDSIPDDPGFRDILLKTQMGNFPTTVTLSLTKKLNPRMSDGDPHWLSIDLRAFSTRSGAPPVTADIANPSSSDGAYEYINDVLDVYNSWVAEHHGKPHPFGDLPTAQETNILPLYSEVEGDPVYNFAIARVRFRAPEGVKALNVRVFFRLWTTGWTALEYYTSKSTGSYPRDGNGSDAAPRLGLYGGEVNTIPCFAEPREAKMSDQEDPANLKKIEGIGADEVYTYYGCWLDFNQNVKRFPLKPDPDDPGPYTTDLLSIQEIMRGLHQCLVAEIHYWPDDEIPTGATTASSDNLAQRNLLLDDSDNPGGFAAHLVHHTFEIKPSPVPFPQIGLQGVNATTGATGRLHPDELIIDWGNLPRDSHVTFYMPQVNVDEVLRFASQRQAPGNLSKVGDHTLSCTVTDVGFIPLPGPFAVPIASLLTVQLPPNLTKGQKFTVVLRQVDGRKLRVIGTTQFDIHVKTATEILPRFKRNLSVLKHIALSIPKENRWYPVFQRYLDELGQRIRAFGANPDDIAPSPTGSGRPSRPERPGEKPGRVPGVSAHTGKIREVIYDCFGDFEGFILDDCGRERVFKSCEKAIEEVVRRACRERLKVTVYYHDKDSARPFKIVIHCC